MASFDYQIHLIATPWLTPTELILPARRGRKLLLFCSVGGGFNWRFDVRPINDVNLAIIQPAGTANQQTVFEYKTYGPLCEAAWFGNDGGAGSPLQIVEVFQIQ